MQDKPSLAQHWPALLLGVLVGGVFIAAMLVFQVRQTDLALLLTFNKPDTITVAGVEQARVFPPGLHFKWPYPIQSVWTHDNRIQCYELKKGQYEQVQTSDDYQVIVSTYVLWRVGDPGRFLRAVGKTTEAEAKLDILVRNARNGVLGRHALGDLINVDPAKVEIPQIEGEILNDLRGVALNEFGIEALLVGFRHIGFPEEVTTKVFDRMIAERNRTAENYRAAGRRDAQKIRAGADLEASNLLAGADAEAKGIRADGDRAAAGYYSVFSQAPELAAFLRKLEALRQVVTDKTTLVLDTATPPYDLLRPGATDLKPTATSAAAPGQ
ncbi:MAG: protease modulator HflC [bacterium]